MAAQLPQNSCPTALDLYPRLVSLPIYPALTEEHVKYVVDAIKDITHKYSRLKIVAVGAPA